MIPNGFELKEIVEKIRESSKAPVYNEQAILQVKKMLASFPFPGMAMSYFGHDQDVAINLDIEIQGEQISALLYCNSFGYKTNWQDYAVTIRKDDKMVAITFLNQQGKTYFPYLDKGNYTLSFDMYNCSQETIVPQNLKVASGFASKEESKSKEYSYTFFNEKLKVKVTHLKKTLSIHFHTTEEPGEPFIEFCLVNEYGIVKYEHKVELQKSQESQYWQSFVRQEIDFPCRLIVKKNDCNGYTKN